MHEADQPGGRRSRLEDEVLEILYRTDRPPTARDRIRARLQARAAKARAVARRHDKVAVQVDSGVLLIACLAAAMLAYLVSDASPLAGRLLGLLSVALLLIPIVRSLVGPQSARKKQWRGRDVDLSSPPRPLWFDRVFRGPRRPRQ
jgi:hypothetical protein